MVHLMNASILMMLAINHQPHHHFCVRPKYQSHSYDRRFAMSLYGVLSSPSQRRSFLFFSCLLLVIGVFGILAIALYAPNTPVWAAVNSLFISIVAGGVFALASGLYLLYFFVDPNDLAATTVLLPKDIGQALEGIAKKATDYKIFVRTGRHFRAVILPILERQARQNRLPIRVEVVLLDFRNETVCDKYAIYRKASSFDHKSWDTRYVQQEVLATILTLIEVSRQNLGLIDIHLFLSGRLSTFRIDGSSDELLVTREDPKDAASRYLRSHRDFSAFVNEFAWIRDEAYRVTLDGDSGLPTTLLAMFGKSALIESLEAQAMQAMKSASPYAR
ncbi:hypothetical protein [Pandoraea sp. PE-S2T-3]|uniref:hypothetical protein n=1 Tax=Pandoraea sp. PE-S2T-3 TaxID=1986993 RepID=UPI0011250B54|nr:hypothetical protein [Pandoraea sp. PE-S2T-3]